MALICTLGDTEDLAAVYVAWTAAQNGVHVLPLPEARLGLDWTFRFNDQDPAAGEILAQGRRYPFGSIHGVYVRFHCNPDLPAEWRLSPLQRHACISERRAGLHQLLHALPCPVANLPSAGRSNASKPYQMRLLEQQGFEIPRWICSNDPDQAAAFVASSPNGVIYKAVSGLRSRVRRFDDELRSRLAAGTTPVILQDYIPGRDVRVHVVSQRVFPTEVRGEGVDYRWEHETARYSPTELPDRLAALCCKAAESENLILAGLDFRVTAGDRWFCLEMNPVPSFLPYEAETCQPIAAALVGILASEDRFRA